MSQPDDSTDLLTDTYAMSTPSSTSIKPRPAVEQKKALGISAAALLLGGTAWAISQKIIGITKPHGNEPEIEETTAPVANQLPKDIDVAGKVTEDMSFEQAFEAARHEVGMGGVFGWHGHWYNTFEKDEWGSLSLEQRQEYTEMITGEKLPVRVYHQPVADNQTVTNNQTVTEEQPSEPTAIEGSLNGLRVIGLDYNHDGVIDVLVMDSADGHIYKVIDATGDDGLDTVYRYDSLDGELTAVVRLDQSIVLSNDQFSQALEESMSREVVDSILEPDASAPASQEFTDEHTVDDDDDDDTDDDDNQYQTASHDSADDTYINDGDVQDMDE
jgi:hypothetical protein